MDAGSESSPESTALIGTFADCSSLARTVEELRRNGFPRERVSVLVGDTGESDPGSPPLWDTLGWLVRLRTAEVWGIGSVIAGGEILHEIERTLAEGAAAGLAAALEALDVPRNEAESLSAKIGDGQHLLIVRPFEPHLRHRAGRILDRERARFVPPARAPSPSECRPIRHERDDELERAGALERERTIPI